MNPTLGLRSDEYIDITPEREVDREKLRAIIFNAVKDTQSAVLLAPLPHLLVMTKAQYDILDPDPDDPEVDDPYIVAAYRSKDRIYLTPLNAMDIVVKDAPILLTLD